MGLALLRKKARIAVELGLTSIKCARFLDKGNILNLDFLEEIDLLQRYRLDSYSKIMDEHYVDSLTEIVERHHIKNTGILMLVPSVSAIVRTLKILSTQVESGLLEEEIKAEIGPIDQTKMEEMQVLCHEIETETPDDHQVPFLVCALPHDTIARSKRIAKAAGLKIDILDLDVVGLYNAFYFFSNGMKSGTFVVVHVDAQYSICLITIPGKPPFFHIIKPDESDSPPISVAQINLSLKTVEETPPSSAEKQWSDIEFFRQVVLEQKRSAPFEELVHEVKKCIRYTQSQEGITHFDRVYLTGIGARSNSLTNLFQDNLQVDTLAWDPLGELYAKSNERPTVDDGFGFTPLLGAILRGGD